MKSKLLTPIVGQWYINKQTLADKPSKYVFAYRVTHKALVDCHVLCSVERINDPTAERETLDFIKEKNIELHAKVFKAVDQATIVAYLL